MKRIFPLLLALLLTFTLTPVTALADGAGGEDLAGSLELTYANAVYTVSTETFVRLVEEPASQDDCGEDEYVTIRVDIRNTSDRTLTLTGMRLVADGTETMGWADVTVGPGKSFCIHIYRNHPAALTPGLHRVSFIVSGRELSAARYSIGRAWSELLTSPTPEQIAQRPADYRSPYLVAWLNPEGSPEFDAYCVDFKSDHIPCGTYSCLFDGYFDYSGGDTSGATYSNDGHISMYGGLQRGAEGKGTNFILSCWDIYRTDENGDVTVIRPKQTYPAGAGRDFTGVEGAGAQARGDFSWVEGRWYRMLLRLTVSQSTGNTVVEQWFQDLTTLEWTHTCSVDLGLPGVRFRANIAVFSENFLKEYAGGVRSLEFTNARILTSDGWADVGTCRGGIGAQSHNSLAGSYGSWEAGSDGNTFYMISTGVPGQGRDSTTDALTVTNRESGDPLAFSFPEDSAGFTDVAPGAYYGAPVRWAVSNQVTTGTTASTFSPDDTCTRAQILTFLWRASGSPEPASALTFTDVDPKSYYADAAAWAGELGIVTGPTLSPDAPCTRLEAVEFIWRAAGSPAAHPASFTDVSSKAVDWAVEQGVTKGTSDTTFSPKATCTRAQIITLLYRALAREVEWRFLFVIFPNTDITYTTSAGKLISDKHTMTDEEIALLEHTALLFTRDMYELSGHTVRPHVTTLVVDTPITFEDLAPYRDDGYKLPASTVRRLLPAWVDIDDFDHVSAFADMERPTMGSLVYLGLGGTSFGQNTGYSFIRNPDTAYTIKYFDETKPGNWPCSVIVHELLHFMEHWTRSLGCAFPFSTDDGGKLGYTDENVWRQFYDDIINYAVMMDDGSPAGVPSAVWRQPPHIFR